LPRATGFVSLIQPQRAICRAMAYQGPCQKDLAIRNKSNWRENTGFGAKLMSRLWVERIQGNR
jgi:hypothetical protein